MSWTAVCSLCCSISKAVPLQAITTERATVPTILPTLMTISEEEFVKALFVNNVTVFVNGSETGFYIDLDAEPDYFMGHLVCIEVDCKYKVEVGGFNG